jgi:hypothetical protein
MLQVGKPESHILWSSGRHLGLINGREGGWVGGMGHFLASFSDEYLVAE